MSRSSRALGVCAAIAVLLATVAAVGVVGTASPAGAGDPHSGTSSITTEIDPGGTSILTSPPIPYDSVKVEVSVSTAGDGGLLNLAAVMIGLPSPGKRVLACLSLAGFELNNAANLAMLTDSLEDFESIEGTVLLSRISMCLYVASLVAEFEASGGQRAVDRAATSPCGNLPLTLKESVEKEADGYHLSASKLKAKKKKERIKVRCRVVSPNKIVMTVQPRKKGMTLRKALGSKNVRLGLANPSTADGASTVKVTFKAP